MCIEKAGLTRLLNSVMQTQFGDMFGFCQIDFINGINTPGRSCVESLVN